MPSLIDPSLTHSTVDVAANYGKMTAQQTYGTGTIYSNFGTRQLRFIQLSAVTGNTGSTAAVNFSTNYLDSFSDFSKAIRAIQTVAEIYYINVPNSTGFVIAVAEDTINDSDSGNLEGGSYGDLETAVMDACTTGTGKTATAAVFTIAAA